jgi:hypothetical protein
MPKTDPGASAADDAATVLAKARASFAAYKGHVTRSAKVFDRQVKLVLGAEPTPQSVSALETAHNDFLTRYNKASAALDIFQDAAIAHGADDGRADDERDALYEDFEQVEEAFVDANARLSRQMRRAHAPAAAAAAPPAGGANNGFREAKGLKPQQLRCTDSHVALREWLRAYRCYYEQSKFDQTTDSCKHQYFYACLEPKLAMRVRPKATRTSAVLNPLEGDEDPTSLETLLRQEFEMFDSVFARRYKLLGRRHHKGIKLSDWWSQTRAEADECDLASLTPDLLLALILTAYCAVPEQQDELMKTDGTLENVLKAMYAFEKRCGDVKTTRGVDPTGTVAAARGGCQSCGGSCRPGDVCPAKGSACSYCGRKNHYAIVCRKKASDQANGVDKPPAPRPPARKPKKTEYKKAKERGESYSDKNKKPTSNSVTPRAPESSSTPTCAGTVSMKATPSIWLHINGEERTTRAMPDTGSCASIIRPDWVEDLGVEDEVDRTERPTLFNANGDDMVVVGTVSLHVKLATVRRPQTEARLRFLVCTNVEGVIIGWEDLIRLGIIAPNFPDPQVPRRLCNRCQTPTVAALSERPDMVSRLLASYKRVFDDSAIRTMKGPAMKIHLREGYVPKRVLTARQTPVHLRDGAEETLRATIESGVIVPVTEPTEWISPAFFVAKATPGKARLVTDYTQLNQYVTRPVHPFPSPIDVMRLIRPESRVFAKLDAYSGYFQIPLEPESSLMTTFILPSGKYRYTRAPMGLNASSDEFCRRTDEALAGISGVVKVVDDILVQGEDYEDLEKRLVQVLKACNAARVTLTRDKFIVGEEVKFAGFIISGNGVKPDPAKLRAIKDYPSPSNISSLRSFLGLANQLGLFHPDLARATDGLRHLLKKNVQWDWSTDVQNSFLRVKELLTSPACVQPYQTGRPTTLVTDASSLNGMGYVLLQDKHLIQAGSRSLNDAETRYAVIELEATAVAWAIKQCRHYLLGCPSFLVQTDHRPLVGTFKKDLASIDNVRLCRIRESLLGYNLQVEYLAGKKNVVADALSRFPIAAAVTPGDDVEEEEESDGLPEDPAIANFAKATAEDEELKALAGVIRARLRAAQLPPSHPARPYSSVLNELSLTPAGVILLDGHRMVVPKPLRSQLVRSLHAAHAGITKTLLHARSKYFWPHMTNDIRTVIDACEACQEHRQGLPFVPSVERKAASPMEAVSVDLMEVRGVKYLVMVDSFPLTQSSRSYGPQLRLR